jgi:predicted metalloprotease
VGRISARIDSRDIQDDDSNDHGGRTDVALGGTTVLPGVTPTLIAIAVFVILIVIVVVGLSFGLPLGHIASDTDPGGEPKQSVQTVHCREGVDVAETTGARPYRYSDKVDQTGDTEPALHANED